LPGIERVDDRGYARTVATKHGHAIVRVRPLEGEHALELHVAGASPAELFALSVATRRMFDLAADPALIARALELDPLLGPLVRARPGLRIAGAWDPFECAVAMLLGPTGTAALVARHGRPIAGPGDGLTHLFPTSRSLTTAAAPLGGPARAVAAGATAFARPSDEVIAGLRRAGLDTDAAEEVALRALGEPDAFPAGRDPAGRELAARAEAWRPWRGYAAVHLRH